MQRHETIDNNLMKIIIGMRIDTINIAVLKEVVINILRTKRMNHNNIIYILKK